MSAADVELVRRIAPPFHGDLKAMVQDEAAGDNLRRFATSDYEFVFAEHEALDIGGAHRGAEATLAVWRQYLEQWQSYFTELTDVIDAGDRVVVLLRERGVSKGGVDLEGESGQVWTIDDGKVKRIEAYQSPESALRAAGLDPR
jgi:ketosteroid isomerase-like protein